jgi:hypothetical protein
LYGLLGASALEGATIHSWLAGWKSDFEAAAQNSRVDARIHPIRLNYYEKAIQALLAGAARRVMAATPDLDAGRGCFA